MSIKTIEQKLNKKYKKVIYRDFINQLHAICMHQLHSLEAFCARNRDMPEIESQDLKMVRLCARKMAGDHQLIGEILKAMECLGLIDTKQNKIGTVSWSFDQEYDQYLRSTFDIDEPIMLLYTAMINFFVHEAKEAEDEIKYSTRH